MDNELLSTRLFGASIEFGVGRVASIADYVSGFNAVKPLIVTDEGVIEAGIIDTVVKYLDASGIKYSVFHDVQPNPTDKNVMNGRDAYRQNGCDMILGVGGGSAIDTAKAIGVAVSHPGHISKYYHPETITREMPVLIAVPTTSGTGSEVSRGGVVTDTQKNQKKVVFTGPPTLALVDPELTVTMPPSLTAATGMDVLCHGVEAYVSNR